METKSPTLVISNASATGSGRSKVALKPRHSLMDWIRYTHSGKDLTSTGGKILEVSPRELSKHNKREDAWIALKGKVYNITPYLDYHPGGEEELMRGAGKDATDLFNQVHQWVNAESMLQKCFVGVLKRSWSLEASFYSVKVMKKTKIPKIASESKSPASCDLEKEKVVANGMSDWNSVSTSNAAKEETSVRINSADNKIIITSSQIRHKELITDLTKDNLFIKFNKDSNTWLNIKFPNIVQSSYEVHPIKENSEDSAIELVCDDSKESCFTGSNTKWKLIQKDESVFWLCKLVKKVAVNYNTYILTFQLPPNVKMWVPVGCHVSVKSSIEGMEIVRSYTPIVPALDNNSLNDSSHLVLMVKIYPSGTLTPILNMCDIGESVLISSYAGTFSENVLKQARSIVMLAAGTGITPMIKVIDWVLTAKDKKRSLLLLFFNKKEDDILWKTEFENCSKNFKNFLVSHILSNSDHKWSGYTGGISEDIVHHIMPSSSSDGQLILICGPLPFTNASLRILEKCGYSKENIHAFTG